MSAFPDVPSDLIEWARRTGRSDDPQAFLPRLDFATYLQDRLAQVADHRLRSAPGRVDDVVPVGGRFEIRTSDVDQHAPTASCSPTATSGRGRCVLDGDVLPAAAWHLRQPLGPRRPAACCPTTPPIVVVGTGLTAVDTVITLLEEGPRRRVVMVSRQGRLPAGPRRAALDRLGPARARGPAHRRPARRARRASRSRDGRRPGRRLARRRRRAARRHPVAVEAPAARRAPPLPRRPRPRVGGAPPPDGPRGRRPDPRLPGRRPAQRAARRHRLDRRPRRPLPGPRRRRGHPDHRPAPSSTAPGPPPTSPAATTPSCSPCASAAWSRPDPLLPRHRHPRRRRARRRRRPRVVPGLYAVGPPRKGTLWESTAIPEIRAQAAAVADGIASPHWAAACGRRSPTGLSAGAAVRRRAGTPGTCCRPRARTRPRSGRRGARRSAGRWSGRGRCRAGRRPAGWWSGRTR